MNELLSYISSSLDPEVQISRTEDHAARSLQTTQYLTLSNQLRDAHATIETLQDRLTDADCGRHAAERCAANRAEFSTMLAECGGNPDCPVQVQTAWHRGCRYHQDVVYGDGGRATQWVGGSDDENLVF